MTRRLFGGRSIRLGVAALLISVSCACGERSQATSADPPSPRESSVPGSPVGESQEEPAENVSTRASETSPPRESTESGGEVIVPRQGEGSWTGDESWAAAYNATGQIAFKRNSVVRGTFEPPERITATWLENTGRAHFFGRYADKSGLGVNFGVNESGQLTGIWIITPVPDFGTATYSFPLDAPVDWLNRTELPATRITAFDGTYTGVIRNVGSRAWEVFLDRGTGSTGGEVPSISTARLRLSVEGAELPWSSIDVEFNVETSDGDSSGRISLVRASDQTSE